MAALYENQKLAEGDYMITDKAQILEEIRRTAAENGGKSLGKDRFAAVTGIRVYDWYGKYWARWGDAIREAGLEPNEFNEAYSEEFLLEHLVAFIREIGHFPVAGELRLKAREDRSFPSTNTFGRFGGKEQLVARVLSFSKERPEHEDVVNICESAANPPPKQRPVKQAAEPEYGFVYLLKSGRFYKIGKSNSVGRRERELAIQLPEKAQMVHSIRTDDPTGIEDYWHKRFANRRHNGEWFELDATDLTAFKRRRFM